MSSYIACVSSFVRINTVMALSLGLAACAAPTDLSPSSQGDASQSAGPAELQVPGLPEFHKPMHARGEGAEGAAKLASGYYYAQGAFNDQTQYGLYTYNDDTYTYVSTSIWGRDGSSVSSGMELAANGESWIQAGSYMVEADGSATGDYSTSYVDSAGVSTLYLTDFRSTSTESDYHSTIDRTDSAASPDCFYDSQWRQESSYSQQQCNRDDGSFWSCAYDFSYQTLEDEQSAAVGVVYLSSQRCDDSRTEASPDYRYQNVMSWSYLDGSYTDQTVVSCIETSGAERTFTYVYSDGVGSWSDESGAAVSGPTCAWNMAEYTY